MLLKFQFNFDAGFEEFNEFAQLSRSLNVFSNLPKKPSLKTAFKMRKSRPLFLNLRNTFF